MGDARKLLVRLSGAILIAAAVMLGATFAPFATQGCIMCPASIGGAPFAFPSLSLFQGLDAKIVLGTVIALALCAAASLMNWERRITSTLTLLLSAAALALVIFEGLDAGGRVIGWDAASPPVQLGPHGPMPYVGRTLSPPVFLDGGFYVFLSAAVVAVIAAVVLFAKTHELTPVPGERVPAQPNTSPLNG